jgi:phage I-like protein
MKKSGVKVNVHSGHDHSPETKRGEVLDIYTKKRDDGTVGLFGKICFLPHLSKQTIQTLVSNDVSVELPQELYDAKGNFYPFPVRRVAITPDPAVSGMSPFVQQRDTTFSVPFLTLSLNNPLSEEKTTMPNDPELFAPNDDIQDEALPSEDIDTDPIEDEGSEPQTPVSGKKKAAFLDSQLVKILFDAFGIDPEDFDEEEDLIAELNVRLSAMLTIQSRLLAALDIKEDDKNKFELLSTRVTELTEFLEQYDADGDGHVDEEDVKETVLNETVEGEDGDEKTIDESLDDLEESDKKLQLSLNNLQRKNEEQGVVIKALVAKNRQLELDNMLQAGEINRATHKKATQKFVLKLSLNDGFDDFIDGAQMNNRSPGQSKTPPQQRPSKIEDTTASWAKVAKKVIASSAPYKRS